LSGVLLYIGHKNADKEQKLAGENEKKQDRRQNILSSFLPCFSANNAVTGMDFERITSYSAKIFNTVSTLILEVNFRFFKPQEM